MERRPHRLAVDGRGAHGVEGMWLASVVVPDRSCATFDAEAAMSRDRTLLDGLGGEARTLWGRSKADPSLAVLVISPIEGAYWEDARRYAYQYRTAPARGEPI